MFERYTEPARRVVFFARYEASAHGSMTIETEHLLLGLVREEKSLLAHFVSGSESEIRQDVERRLAVRRKVSTSVDLPLTEESKNILKYAYEEAEKLGHWHLGTEHLLLGILRESGCLAAQILREHGVELDAVRKQATQVASERVALPESPISASRETVHTLIDKLPESSLGWVRMMLDRMVAGTPGSMSMAAFGGHQLQRDTEGKMKEGRFTSERRENRAIVSETQHFHHGHQISVTEKLRLSEDGKKLLYSQEIVGPNPEQQHKHSMEFDVA